MVRSHIRSDRPADSLFATGVHEQLRELAFSKRVKMHALIMEGLDTVFPARGLRSVADLTNKGRYPAMVWWRHCIGAPWRAAQRERNAGKEVLIRRALAF